MHGWCAAAGEAAGKLVGTRISVGGYAQVVLQRGSSRGGVQIFPIAKPDDWRAFVESIDTGERGDAHRQALRRLGVKREHVFHQTTPAGDVMVLVWEGVEQGQQISTATSPSSTDPI
jgi:hypothetical protein